MYKQFSIYIKTLHFKAAYTSPYLDTIILTTWRKSWCFLKNYYSQISKLIKKYATAILQLGESNNIECYSIHNQVLMIKLGLQKN